MFVPEAAEFVDCDSKSLELVSGLSIDLVKRLKLVVIKPLGFP